MSTESYEAMAPYIERLTQFIERVEETSGEDTGEVELLKQEAELMVNESKDFDDPIVPELIQTLNTALKALEAVARGEESPV